jgi:hypothetical protein
MTSIAFTLKIDHLNLTDCLSLKSEAFLKLSHLLDGFLLMLYNHPSKKRQPKFQTFFTTLSKKGSLWFLE